MYAYYNGGIDKLTQDDIWAIQYLYGRPERLKYELIPTTTKQLNLLLVIRLRLTSLW
jgi:hypothetical protein